jgi:bisphosphoglycerate-independent phosphoglycerate mutase (AlkP superfamily)
LEDIERDTLIRENERDESKELAPQPTQHIQLSYSNNPQDVFVTPTPSGNAHFTIKGKKLIINFGVRAKSLKNYFTQLQKIERHFDTDNQQYFGKFLGHKNFKLIKI